MEKFPVEIKICFEVSPRKDGGMHIENEVILGLNVPDEIEPMCFKMDQLGLTGRGHQLIVIGAIYGAAACMRSADAQKFVPIDAALEEAITMLQQMCKAINPINIENREV